MWMAAKLKPKKNLKLMMPDGNTVWLIVGNSVTGKHSWSGEVGGLAMYDQTIPAQMVETHYKKWKQEESLSFAKEDNPRHLYLFNEGQGGIVKDHCKEKQDLRIPNHFKILKKQFLVPPWTRFKANKSFFSDFFVNMLGFVPLGFILVIVLSWNEKFSGQQIVVAVVVLCFGLSLFIEVAQAWLPSWSSDLLDLVLNTVGGWLGALLGGITDNEMR
jgi:hypothetical protein